MSELVISNLDELRDSIAVTVTDFWTECNNKRRPWLDRALETRKYVTAPNTTHTEVGSLPWKNKTTIPKLTQIADNLQSYYMAALMPSDDWFKWEGRDMESQDRADLIEAYMQTKVRTGGFRKELEKIVRDWIIYGNCFAGVTYVREQVKSLTTGEKVTVYAGPKLIRISPLDCVIDPKASNFNTTPFVRRRMVTMGDILKHLSEESPIPYDADVVNQMITLRGGARDVDTIEQYKNYGLQVDGFDTFIDYLNSQSVEILEYWGDIYVQETGEILTNRSIIIADRFFVLSNRENPSWTGAKPFAHSGWRTLPDNLYGQGPLDNLVGMQYRCDHLENLKADAFDQIVHPVLKIKGDCVEEFTWGPGEQIYCGADGDVESMSPDWSVLQCDNQIAMYHNYMEAMAGSPKESMGFRSPGEKTAFEVQVLQQGADRMFQDKLNHFEEFVIEPILNLMFELLIRNMDPVDVARVFNDEAQTMEIIKFDRNDVVADGVLRPVGAKHFSMRNKRVQELQSFLQISQTPSVAPHVSGLRAAKMFSEELGFDKYMIVEENIAIREQMKTQLEMQQGQQAMQGMMPDMQQAGGIPNEP